jgi:hypothetical protein
MCDFIPSTQEHRQLFAFTLSVQYSGTAAFAELEK